MKKLLKKSLVLVIVLLTAETYANTPIFHVYNETKKVVSINFEDIHKGSTLMVKDKNDNVLFKESIEKTGTYSKSFDLRNLPNNDYYIELDNQYEIIITPFKIGKNTIKYLKDQETKILKPSVIVKNDTVYISKITKDEQTWNIKVFNEHYELVYHEKLEDTNRLGRIYDFSTSKKGNYIILINSEGREYKNIINI